MRSPFSTGLRLTIRIVKNESEEAKTVECLDCGGQSKSGLLPHEFGIFVRSEEQLDRAQAAAMHAGMPCKVLDDHVETTSGHLSICNDAPGEGARVSRRRGDGLR